MINRKGVDTVNTKEAIAKRIIQLCNERNIAINELASVSGISPSTVYSILDERSQNPGAVTIKKIRTTITDNAQDWQQTSPVHFSDAECLVLVSDLHQTHAPNDNQRCQSNKRINGDAIEHGF